MKTAEVKQLRLLYFQTKIDIFAESKESENSEWTHSVKHYPQGLPIIQTLLSLGNSIPQAINRS